MFVSEDLSTGRRNRPPTHALNRSGLGYGRFLQTDPVGYEDQINLYAYVMNDPVNKTDPTGKQSVDDMQLQMQIADMRQQGTSEKQILQEIGGQAGTQAAALGTMASIAIPIERIASLVPRAMTALRNATVVNVKTGLTVNQTKAIGSFFGKGADGAKAVIQAAGKPGFSLPKGVTEKSLQTYRNVAERAIQGGKPAEVQRLRIEAIDKTLKALRD